MRAIDDQVIIDYAYKRDNLLTGYDTYTDYEPLYDPCFVAKEITVDGLGRLASGTEILTDKDGVTISHVLDYEYDMMSQLTSASITNIGGAT